VLHVGDARKQEVRCSVVRIDRDCLPELRRGVTIPACMDENVRVPEAQHGITGLQLHGDIHLGERARRVPLRQRHLRKAAVRCVVRQILLKRLTVRLTGQINLLQSLVDHAERL